MADLRKQRLGALVINGKLQMLGCQAVDQRHGILKPFDDNDRAIGLPAFGRDRPGAPK